MNQEFGMLKGSRVLVTGGLGFIGSNLILKLVRIGAVVTILDAMLPQYGSNVKNIEEVKDRVKIVVGDVRDSAVVAECVKAKDYIFHLAAQVNRAISMDDPMVDVDINLKGTLNVLEACRKQNDSAKMIYAGSRVQVGDPIDLPVNENHPTNPNDIYGVNKLAAEKYCFVYHRAYGINVTSLRLGNVYGPRGQLRNTQYGFVNLFIGYALSNKPIPIWGEGQQTRDCVYVEDVIDAFLLASMNERSNGEVFMVGSGREMKLLDIAKTIMETVTKLTGIKTTYIHKPFPEVLRRVDVPRFAIDFRKIHQYLGWLPKTDFVQGTYETVRFYKRNLHHYLK
jgi:nucleoside-diphosphate-sugar epimerase